MLVCIVLFSSQHCQTCFNVLASAAKRRLPPLNLNPGTSVNDNKREATLKDLLADSSQSQGEHLPSLPKAPRLELRSPERETCEEDGDDAQGANISVPFSIPELEQHGCFRGE